MKSQITNSKSQINSNDQNSNDRNRLGHLVIGIWVLFVIWCLVFGILTKVCHAQTDWLDYLGKNRDHFGVEVSDALGAKERFFVGGDINELGTSLKACAEKKEFLGPSYTLGVEAQDAFLDDKRYRQETAGAGIYLYTDADEWTRFSTEFKYYQPEVYHLRDTADSRIRKYSGTNDVSTLLFRCENYPVDNEYPTKGRRTDLSLEVSSKAIGSDFDFLRTKVENGFYYTPTKWIFKKHPLNKITFVLIAKAGWMRKTGSEDEIPFFERFYAGGTSTVRGYKPRYLAPRDSEDLPLGGNCMAVLTAEMRYPVYKDIKGAIFYDQGNAWKNSDDLNLEDTKAGIGTGLRWAMRFGVLRFDYGYGLNGGTRQRDGRVHLSLGMKF